MESPGINALFQSFAADVRAQIASDTLCVNCMRLLRSKWCIAFPWACASNGENMWVNLTREWLGLIFYFSRLCCNFMMRFAAIAFLRHQFLI
jgi:hypothetical protein